MNLGPVVDVGIGLIFVYLLLGLATLTLQEVVANALKLRGRQLRDALAHLVGNGDPSSDLFKGVFHHPLVRNVVGKNVLPSYLPSRTFALAVMDVLSDGTKATAFTQAQTKVASLPEGITKDALKSLLQHAGGDIEAFRTSLATWYDDAMDRVSGQYKRFSQVFALSAGFVLAVVLNVDSIRIADSLWRNETMRANVAAAAQAFSDRSLPASSNGGGALASNPQLLAVVSGEVAPPNPQPPANANGGDDPASKLRATRAVLDDQITQLFQLDIPIGWLERPEGTQSAAAIAQVNLGEIPGIVGQYFSKRGFGGGLLVVIGWLITGLATSLGAPFWFDALKNLLNVRSAGPRPKRADEAPVAATA